MLVALGTASYVYAHNTNRWFNKAIRLLQAGRFDEAQTLFQRIVRKEDPITNLAAESAYYAAFCDERQNNVSAAIQGFLRLIETYPHGSRTPEALYYLGTDYFETGEAHKGREYLQQLADRYPSSAWGKQALERLEKR
jgi:TolA-binding protein